MIDFYDPDMRRVVIVERYLPEYGEFVHNDAELPWFQCPEDAREYCTEHMMNGLGGFSDEELSEVGGGVNARCIYGDPDVTGSYRFYDLDARFEGGEVSDTAIYRCCIEAEQATGCGALFDAFDPTIRNNFDPAR